MILGIAATIEIELAFDYHPGIPATNESKGEIPFCEIFSVKRKAGEKWIKSDWLIDILNEQGQMGDLQIELLNYCDCG